MGAARCRRDRQGHQRRQRDSSPARFTQVGSTVLFVATDATTGQELWKTDGTAAGTVRVKDINPGTTGSSITSSIGVIGSTAIFGATDGLTGVELWKSDGTESGTVLVKDINPGSAGSVFSISPFVTIGSNTFFAATDGVNGTELWSTDGTAAGTMMVKDVNGGSGSGSPDRFTALGSTLLFAATDTTNGQELWASDGTSAGTVLVKDINSGLNSSSVGPMVTVGGSALFSASNGTTNGAELWKSDGTNAGTVMVKDIQSGTGGSSPINFAVAGGSAYFQANEGTVGPATGAELWRSDGTAAGTVLVKDINTGTVSSSPAGTTAFGSSVLFRATVAATGSELYISDGTSLGTVLVKDIFSSPATSSSSPTNFAVLGSTAYFSASTGTVAPGTGIELWSTDGTSSGTVQVRDINPGTGSSSPANLTPALGTVLLSASDGTSGSARGTELWRVRTNAAPVVADDTYSTKIDSAYARTAPGVLGNDTDPDGDTLVAGSASDPANGSVVLNADGSFVYTPDAGYSGPDAFTYVASDGLGGSATASVTFTVAGINTAPVAGDDASSTNEDTPLTVIAPGVLTNDSDADGDPIKAGSATAPANGTVALNLDGSFTYTPNIHFNGTDSFTYTVSDDYSGTDTATVTITVTPVNDSPAATNDVYTTDLNTPVTVGAPGVLRNDVEHDGDAMTAGSASDPPNGSVVLNADGSFTYTPDTGFLGSDTFTYAANDGVGGPGTATVTVFVTAASALAPDATQAASVDSAEALGNAASSNTPSLSIDGNLIAFFSPATNLVPGDTNATADIFVRNLAAGTTERVNVDSAGVQANGAQGSNPRISGDGRFVVFTSAATNLVPGDTNARVDVFVKDRATGGIERVNISETGVVVGQTSGQIFALRTEISADGRYVAFNISHDNTTNPGRLYVRDRQAGTTEIVSVDPSGTPIPGVGSVSYSTRAISPDGRFVLYNSSATTLVANDTNGVNDLFLRDRQTATTERVNVSSSEGEATAAVDNSNAGISADGARVVFSTGASNLVAGDTNGSGDGFLRDRTTGTTSRLTVDASGGETPAGVHSGGTMSISYDGRMVNFETPATLVPGDTNVPNVETGVNGFDVYVRDLEANTITVESVSSTGVQGIGFSFGGNLSGDGRTLAYSSDASNLVANDTNGTFDLFAHSLVPTPPNVPPVAVDDAYSATEDAPLVVPASGVLANDTDSDGGTLTAGSASDPANGSVVLNADGSFTYTPDADFSGSDGFTYDVSDGQGGTDTGTVTVTVASVNDGPLAVDDAYSGTAGSPLTVAAPGVLGNDSDPDGGTLTAGSASDPANGSVAVNADGSFTYTTDLGGFSGTDSFTYEVSDGQGGTATATVSITISPSSAATTVSVADLAVAEGDAGPTAATFTVTRSGNATGSSTVKYKTSGGNASAGSDYSAVSTLATIGFAPFETTKTVTVDVAGDDLPEGDETFKLVLSAPTGAVIADASATATIVNDDGAAYVSVGNVSVTEGNTGPTPAAFTVTRSGNTNGTSTVKYKTGSGTATAGADYTGVSLSTLEFTAGETSKTVTIDVTGDTANESNENFSLTLSAPVGATIADAAGVAYITDDDGPVTPAASTFLSVGSLTVDEGNTGATAATFTVTRTGNTAGASAVKYKTTNGTATAGSDYAALVLDTLSFAAGETSKTVTVDVTGDTLPEANETFNLVLSAPTGGVIADATATATVVNDDGAAYLSVGNTAVAEGDSGTATATFTITRSGNTSGSSTVTYKTTNGSATAGSDYTAVAPTPVTFAPGQTTKTVTVDVTGDPALEKNETFNLVLSAASGATVSDPSGAATITNDD